MGRSSEPTVRHHLLCWTSLARWKTTKRIFAAQFTTFITELNTYSTDWQIIVANQDNGCNQTSGVLRPTDSDYVTRFQSAVSAGGGWWTEAGLTITSQAVEMTDPGECNQGFLRSDAMLHIIMVSDESEQSTSSWNWYADKVVAKKGSSANVKFFGHRRGLAGRLRHCRSRGGIPPSGECNGWCVLVDLLRLGHSIEHVHACCGECAASCI